MSRRPPKVTKRASPKSGVKEKLRAPHQNRHISLPRDAFDALSAAIGGYGNSPVRAILEDLKPGESAVTSLSPMSFNKYRSKYNLKTKSGFFYIQGETFSPVKCCIVTRGA